MERELIMTGIGGQGVQLAAAVVARAALLEGRDVQVFGSYGGMMRGGATEATVVVADGPVEAPPTVALDLVGRPHAPRVRRRRSWPGSTRTVWCSSTPAWSTGPTWPADARWSRCPATDIAARASATSWPPRWSWSGPTPRSPDWSGWHRWSAASRASLPSYRTQHAALNDEALRAGFGVGARSDRPGVARAGRWRPMSRPAAGGHPGHGGHRRRGVQGMRPVHRRLPARACW